jgi:hypothetical protein
MEGEGDRTPPVGVAVAGSSSEGGSGSDFVGHVDTADPDRRVVRGASLALRLVTEGPYRVVRHPLYVCEGIATVGVMLQVISPLAVLIVIGAWMVQYRRMINEEKILSAAFPEYRAYAARTPLVIPAACRLLSALNSRLIS